ncbi:unnamed protein product [Aphanomyces euteiches]
MVIGVTDGFTKNLELVGVGYRANKNGDKLVLNVGYSHPVEILPESGIEFDVPSNTKITVKGIDKELIGATAAKIRSVREPEPYKGKGIKYEGERILRKEGKAEDMKGVNILMITKSDKNASRLKRHLRHMYAQIIDDTKGVTIVAASTLDKTLGEAVTNGGNIDAARQVGTLIAQRAKEQGVVKVVFDRGGYLYHGRVQALADAAREAGLEF